MVGEVKLDGYMSVSARERWKEREREREREEEGEEKDETGQLERWN